MRTTQFHLTTLKEPPAEAEVISHQLMLRAGMIRKHAAGLYSWLPLGLRVLRKVEAAVRRAMNAVGALEVALPLVQPAELWSATGRWEKYGPELLRLKDRHQRDFCLGPTHEEIITDLARRTLKSYKQLPATFYQIQTKFRDEIRPRFGVLRAREFLMKDAYSFHLDAASLEASYQAMYRAYGQLLAGLGLQFRAVLADTGNIGGRASHEFHVLAGTGEDLLFYSDESDYAANRELLPHAAAGDPSPDGRGRLRETRGIEVGHILQLGTQYSLPIGAQLADESGAVTPLEMGCYGLGISRIVAASIEQHHDARGIYWPPALAPFQIVLIPVGYHRMPEVCAATDALYAQLCAAGFEVLLEDRDIRPGIAFTEMELIGIPHRLVISERGLSQKQVEYQARGEAANSQGIPQEQAIPFLKGVCSMRMS